MAVAGVNSMESQHIPGESKSASYVSRLECMKLAASTHLQRLHVRT